MLIDVRTYPVWLGVVLLQPLVSGVLAGLPMTVPRPAAGAKGRDRPYGRRVSAPFTLAVLLWSRLVIASNTTPHHRQQGAHDDHRDSNPHHCSATHRRVSGATSALS